MYSFKLNIGGFTFQITSNHPNAQQMCYGYIVDDTSVVDCCISISYEDIDKEKEYVKKEYARNNEEAPCFTDGDLETTSIYRKIGDYLSHHDACVFHGALIERQGVGYLFTAPSGTGKTTHIRNWKKVFPDTKVVNGDKPILRKDSRGIIVGYGTPWCGKEGYNNNTSVPVKAIVVLERGLENSIEELKPIDALEILLAQCHRPDDNMGLKRAMDMCISMCNSVKFYKLSCNMDPSSAQVAYDGISFEA